VVGVISLLRQSHPLKPVQPIFIVDKCWLLLLVLLPRLTTILMANRKPHVVNLHAVSKARAFFLQQRFKKL